MILFLYPEEPDVFFEDTIDWIDAYNVDHAIIRGSLNSLIQQDISIFINDKMFKIDQPFHLNSLENVSQVVTRGFISRRAINVAQVNNSLMTSISKSIVYDSLFQEIRVLYSFLYSIHSNEVEDKAPINKLISLQTASKFGILIPCTIVTNNTEELIKFIDKYGKIITKPMWEGPSIQEKGLLFSHTTKIVTKEMIEDENIRFLPSMFQEYIEKEYEIRSLFFHGQFFSMAIFSQKNSKTQVDYRNYSRSKPSRTVAYRLPLNIRKKITRMMKELKLSSGSIDIIYNSTKGYVFLEVNPKGRIGMISGPCNYNIEEVIAKKIIENEL